MDGPLTRAVRAGAICYLDEVVEARKDTTVVIHPLSDHRRILPIEKTAELVQAHPDFLLVISYNPGYQSVLKDLKPSTRQRFVSLEFDYPGVDVEAEIIAHEGGAGPELARQLALVGEKMRNLREHGFHEGVSTRLLVYAAQLDRRRHRAAAGLRRRHRLGRQRRRRGAAGGRRDRRRPAAVSVHDRRRPCRSRTCSASSGCSPTGWPERRCRSRSPTTRWTSGRGGHRRSTRRSCACPAVAVDHGALRAVVLHHTGLTEFGSFDGRDERERRFAETSRPAARAAHLRRPRGPADRRRRRVRTTRARVATSTPCSPPPGRPRPTRRPSSGGRRSWSRCSCTRSVRRTTSWRPGCCRACGRCSARCSTSSDRSTRSTTATVPRSRSARCSTTSSTSRATRRTPSRRPSTSTSRARSSRPTIGPAPTPTSPDRRRTTCARSRPTRRRSVGSPTSMPSTPSCPVEEEARGPDRDADRSRSLRHATTTTTRASTSTTSGTTSPGATLPAWCRVVERRLDGDDRSFIGDVRRRHGVLIGRLRRQLAFMRPEGWVRVHHADEGDELDLDAVIEAVVDRRTGHSVDDRLHVRRDRAVRDVATAFLVDLSASTSSPIPDEEAIAAAAAAAQAEEEMIQYRGGWIDPYELPPAGGRPAHPRRRQGVGRRAVRRARAARRPPRRLRVLGRDARTTSTSTSPRSSTTARRPATWGALAAMRSLKYTRMGPAVRHATAKLAAQPTRTKLLMVISDGYPQDVDYGPGARRPRVRPAGHGAGAAGRGRRRRHPVPADDRSGRPRLPAPDAAGPLLRRHRRRRRAAARAGDAVRQRGVDARRAAGDVSATRCAPPRRRRGAASPTARRRSAGCPRRCWRSRTAG